MFNMESTLDAEDKIIKARVTLGREQPFFGYLVMSLNLVKDKNLPTMAVDANGNLYYNPDFVDKLSQNELEGVVCHEVMHCALQHLHRTEERNHQLANIAQDTVINDTILESNLTLPQNVIYPQGHEVKLFGSKIKDIHKKCNEEIYDELYQKIKKQISDGKVGTGGSGGGMSIDDFLDGHKDTKKQFDKHIRGKGKKNNGNKMTEQDWQDRFTEAATYAKLQGNVPAGIERRLGKILGSEIDWKGMLYRFITNAIPYDFTWARPNKRSRALGTYFPDVVKEKLDLVVDVDTSGSIGQEELVTFMSEIVSIVKQFHNVELNVLFSDTEVYGPHKFQNPNPEEICDLKPTGGGGTDHIMLYDWLDENMPQTKILINFTDGYTSFPEHDHGYPTIWVIAGDWHCGKEHIPWGDIVEIPRK